MNDSWWIDEYEIGGENFRVWQLPLFKYLHLISWVMTFLMKSKWRVFKYKRPEFFPLDTNDMTCYGLKEFFCLLGIWWTLAWFLWWMMDKPVGNDGNTTAVIHRKRQRQWVNTHWGWQFVGEKTLGNIQSMIYQ